MDLHRTRLIEILGELLLQFLVDFVGQLLFELVAAIATESGKRIRGHRRTRHPILAYASAILLGAAAGRGSAQFLPERIVHHWPLPGFSLFAAPLATGVVMRAYGRWGERRGYEVNLFGTFWGASTTAFAFALVRFLLVR